MLRSLEDEVEHLRDQALKVRCLVGQHLANVSEWEREQVDVYDAACSEFADIFDRMSRDVRACRRILHGYTRDSESE